MHSTRPRPDHDGHDDARYAAPSVVSAQPRPPADSIGPSPTRSRPSRARILLGLFYVGGSIFVLVAVTSTLDRAAGRISPTPAAVAIAFCFSSLALRSTARGWVELIAADASRHELARSVYVSQLGKYVPGGVMQAAGQLGMATRAGVPLRDALPAYLAYAGQVAAASLLLGSILVTQVSVVGGSWAVIGGLGSIAILAAWRPVAAGALRWAARVLPRISRMGQLPAQASLYRCFARQLLFALGQGAAFATLLRALDPGAPILAAVAAHSFAFGVGLLAVPVPSGLLVREGILIAILHSSVPGGSVVTAAIFLRLIAISTEVLMIVSTWLTARSRARHRRER